MLSPFAAVALAVVSPQGGGAPPVAEAGPDRLLVAPQSALVLDAEDSRDAEDLLPALQAAWTQISGPTVAVLDGASSFRPQVSGLGIGDYEFQVTVLDSQGLSDSDTVRVRVLAAQNAGATLSGTPRTWHPQTLTFVGPLGAQSGAVNPFLEYRLSVLFSHLETGRRYEVPGYFAADGNSAQSHASSGNAWRCRFTPDLVGTWNWTARFETGPQIAVADLGVAGTALPPIHGAAGSFTVGRTDKAAPDLRGLGRPLWRGGHHLIHGENGRAFLRVASESPSNLLGFSGFDGTYDTGGIATPGLPFGLHAYPTHLQDWQPGDPDWSDDALMSGRAVVGLVNDLASRGLGGLRFSVFNALGGEGGDTWPFASISPSPPSAWFRTRFDCSKLDQWDLLFGHMDARGLQIHLVTQEPGNETVLDGGALGVERRLFYRELVARFAHHVAVVWDLGSSSSLPAADLASFAAWLRALDPYDHPIVVQSAADAIAANGLGNPYSGLYGDPSFDGASVSGDGSSYHDWAVGVRTASGSAGRPWVVWGDGQTPAVAEDLSNRAAMRRDALWGNLLGGGSGVAWSLEGGLETEDLSAAADLWGDSTRALEFLRTHVEVRKARPADGAISGALFALEVPDETFVVCAAPATGPITLDLGANQATWDLFWFDPRGGAGLDGDLQGTVLTVTGPGIVNLGHPPGDTGQDWILLAKSRDVARYGAGFPCHDGRLPHLRFPRPPLLGDGLFEVEVEDAPPGRAVHLLLGFAADFAPLGAVGPGAVLVAVPDYVFPFAQSGTADQEGRCRFPVPIPSDPVWLGVEGYFQAVVVDARSPIGVGLSAGLRGTVR